MFLAFQLLPVETQKHAHVSADLEDLQRVVFQIQSQKDLLMNMKISLKGLIEDQFLQQPL